MAKSKLQLVSDRPAPLSIEELEVGLRKLNDDRTDLNSFWDEHVAAFRQTVLLAIRETSNALLVPTIPLRWRLELEGELEELIKYIAMADRYIERRAPRQESLAYVRPARFGCH